MNGLFIGITPLSISPSVKLTLNHPAFLFCG